MAVFINKLAREWYSKHLTGVTAQTPLNQLKRRYYLEYLGAKVSNSRTAGLGQLEKMWLAQYTADHFGPTVDYNYESIEWIDICLSIGVTPSKYEQQNKINFYLNAP